MSSTTSNLDGFSDMLQEINRQGDLIWVTQQKYFTENLYKRNRTPEQLKNEVLKSARLKHVIRKIIENNQQKQMEEAKKETTKSSINKVSDEVQKKIKIIEEDLKSKQAKIELETQKYYVEASKILDEMANNFDLKYVRLLGYFLIKVFKRIYKHIYYNTDLNIKISEISKKFPIIYLPNHRSYMDFLLVSLVCFHANIQMPVIAAGQDFLGLSFLSKFIRNSGAFFIRRSFGSDELYWAIFHEYVQQIIRNADAPIEFFLEGMRSRTSKCLLPKQGMLATCMECLFKSQISDLYLVPISITYERLLEEMLYSNELLGIPKPKENVSGLIKAHTILKQCYGTIIVNFSEPLSVRELISRQNFNLNRLSHTLTPRFIFELDQTQLKSIESLSYTILINILSNQIIQPISLISSAVLIKSSSKQSKEISLKDLLNDVLLLKRILNNLGYKFYWPLNYNMKINMKMFLLNFIKLHLNVFDIIKYNPYKNSIEIYEGNDEDESDIGLIYIKIKQDLQNLFLNSSIYLAVCSYRNQIINYLVNLSFTSISLVVNQYDNNFQSTCLNTNIFRVYKFLVSLFNKEFVFHPNEINSDYEKSLTYLRLMNIINYSNDKNEIKLLKYNYKQLKTLIYIYINFLYNYLIIYKIILINKFNVFINEKHFAKQLQDYAFEYINKLEDYPSTTLNSSSGSASMTSTVNTIMNIRTFKYDYELLSLNLISNSILALKNFAILIRYTKTIAENAQPGSTSAKIETSIEYKIDLDKLNGLYNELNTIILSLNTNLIQLDNLFDSDNNGLTKTADDETPLEAEKMLNNEDFDNISPVIETKIYQKAKL